MAGGAGVTAMWVRRRMAAVPKFRDLAPTAKLRKVHRFGGPGERGPAGGDDDDCHRCRPGPVPWPCPVLLRPRPAAWSWTRVTSYAQRTGPRGVRSMPPSPAPSPAPPPPLNPQRTWSCLPAACGTLTATAWCWRGRRRAGRPSSRYRTGREAGQQQREQRPLFPVCAPHRPRVSLGDPTLLSSFLDLPLDVAFPRPPPSHTTVRHGLLPQQRQPAGAGEAAGGRGGGGGAGAGGRETEYHERETEAGGGGGGGGREAQN